MSFTKTAMQEELSKFLVSYGKQIEQLYGASDSTWTEIEAVQASPIWGAVSDMYDYGITGIPTEYLFPKGHIDGVYAHTEMFFRGMNTPDMKLYLEASGNTLPRLAMSAVQSAVARMVLDDGWRHTDYGGRDYGVINGDMNHLTISEIALLANMDERSVRNAANPKLPDPLKTEMVGKRSLVNLEEARRWLAGRKGFIPTEAYEGTTHRPPEYNLHFTENDLQKIEEEANKIGISTIDYLRLTINNFNKMQK